MAYVDAFKSEGPSLLSAGDFSARRQPVASLAWRAQVFQVPAPVLLCGPGGGHVPWRRHHAFAEGSLKLVLSGLKKDPPYAALLMNAVVRLRSLKLAMASQGSSPGELVNAVVTLLDSTPAGSESPR
jgi:hypothetical protein